MSFEVATLYSLCMIITFFFFLRGPMLSKKVGKTSYTKRLREREAKEECTREIHMLDFCSFFTTCTITNTILFHKGIKAPKSYFLFKTLLYWLLYRLAFTIKNKVWAPQGHRQAGQAMPRPPWQRGHHHHHQPPASPPARARPKAKRQRSETRQ